MNDATLMREFVEQGSEPAFAELTRRHVNMVYGTALRKVLDPGLAEEVTQNVFLVLARKAAFLPREESLAPWLYKTTLFEARHCSRTELRRQRREETAVALGATMKEDPSLLRSLAAVLDEALLDLGEKDRAVLLLRYLEEKSVREVGETLGLRENTAQKRLTKALESLTAAFRRRGYTVPAVTVTAAVLGGSAQAAPAGLAGAVAHAACQQAGVTAATGLALILMKFMSLTKIQVAALCVLAAAGPIAYEWRALAQARTDQDTLQQRIASARDDRSQYQREMDRLRQTARKVGASLEQAQADRRRQQAAFASRQPVDESKLYLWDEQSEYVRFPKEMASELGMSQLVGAKHEVALSPQGLGQAILEKGFLSESLRDALALQPEEETRLQAAFQAAYRDYQGLAATHTKPLPQPPSQFNIFSGETQTLQADPFPEEGKAWREQLCATMDLILGADRAAMLWKQIESPLDQYTDEFGKWLTVRTLRIHRLSPDPRNSPFWTEYCLTQYPNGRGVRRQYFHSGIVSKTNASGASIPVEEPSRIFQPFLEDWKKRQAEAIKP